MECIGIVTYTELLSLLHQSARAAKVGTTGAGGWHRNTALNNCFIIGTDHSRNQFESEIRASLMMPLRMEKTLAHFT